VSSLQTFRRLYHALPAFAALLVLKFCPLPITVGIWALAHHFSPATWRPLKNYRFWLMIALLVIAVPLFTGNLESRFLGIPYSADQLGKMLLMSTRGISVFLFIQILTTNLDSQRTRKLLSTLGLQKYDTLFDLSREALPALRSIMGARIGKFKNPQAKGHLPKHPLRFATTVLEDIIQLAEKLSMSLEQEQPLPQESLIKQVNEKLPHLVVVYGDPGSGKSPWTEKLVDLLRQQGHSVAGFISHKVVSTKDSWYHELENLSDGSRTPLNSMEYIPNALSVGKFYFVPGVFQWAREGLQSHLESEWIVLDEIGPLEMNSGGFALILEALDESFQGVLVISLRSNLLEYLDEVFADYSNLLARDRTIIQMSQPFAPDLPQN